jgi:two-component system nitrate/nitrite sensor histidine kinase NarX
MNIKRKFYLYLLATIGLAFPLAESIHLTYSSGESIFVIFLITIIAFYYYLYIRIRKDFLAPFSDLQRWVKDYKQNQNARLKDRDDSSFNSVAQAINHLIDENQNLYDDMETILKKQIDRLSKKTASLETLYEVSSKINKLKSIDEIYKHFLDIFIKMTGASSGAVRIFNKLNQLELQTSFGSKNKAGLEKVIDPHQCFCGEIANSTSAQVQFSVKRCVRCIGTKASDKATVGTIVVPLSYREVNLGIFLLFFDSEPSLPYDERALIQSMADNIAIAIDKARVDDESKRMSLTQQRLLLS